MISIKKKSELLGAEKYGQCASCARRSSEVELYQISFTYDESTKETSVDLCEECVIELANAIFVKTDSEFDLNKFLSDIDEFLDKI